MKTKLTNIRRVTVVRRMKISWRKVTLGKNLHNKRSLSKKLKAQNNKMLKANSNLEVLLFAKAEKRYSIISFTNEKKEK